MYGPSSANSFAKQRLPSMANASNAEFEGQGHMKKPYDGRCFCDLAVVPLKSKTKTTLGRARRIGAVISNGWMKHMMMELV
ncbi:hypothetical protein PIB30_034813 [Stylosanthes scabra]|uniref:Uncharacterized protein n=1 Tax=Stylosanthes scabra TaxID=79078 RepID=A0ABU6UCC0_9FABA|nr:hypothetical protein [Stylosanthes scabra]